MGELLNLQYEIMDLKQELQIRTEQNAELYAKLCNALMQLEDANRVITSYIRNFPLEKYGPAESYCDRWKVK